MFPPEAIHSLLSQRQSLITARQLRSAGIPVNTIRSWTTRQWLVPVERGVYRVAGAPRTPTQRILAAVLRCGPEARAGGWTACALHGLEGFPLRAQRWVSVPPTCRVRGVAFILQRVSIPATERATVNGIPTVSPQRALIDAATRVGGRRLRVAIDDARRRDLIELDGLLARATALGRHAGAVQTRRLFSGGLLDQDGEAERWLAVGLAGRGIYPLWGPEILPGVFPDAVLPAASLIVECDGGAHHTIHADRASDASREALLRAADWHVLRFTATQLRRDLDAVLDTIVAAHDERRAAGLGKPADWEPLTPGRRLRPPASG